MSVRGAPTPEQLAALLAVVRGAVGSTPGATPGAPPPAASLWAGPDLRTQLAPGPGGWRASALSVAR